MSFPIAEKLYQGQDLSKEETLSLFQDIFAGKIDPVMLSSVLTALKIKGETPVEVAAAASAMIGAATPFEQKRDFQVGEIVGTGGDGHNTINISTMSAVVASSLGLHIAKHGNRGVSSKSGASDFLEAFDINIRMTPDQAFRCLDAIGLTFLFAQVYHSGMKYAGPVRKALGTRTIFNILGPLTNPSRPDYMVMGVYSKELIGPMAQALHQLGMKKALVVWGSGIDEIAVHGPTYAAMLDNGFITSRIITPDEFGLGTFTLDDIKGGEPEENVAIARNVFEGRGTPAQMAAVQANAGALLYVAGKAGSFREGADMVLEQLKNGGAARQIREFARLSKMMEA
ncbi:MAG: anthranilate phosphoribosyltransferase [Succinimonas sp.]|jgi:anthranilate phosphoribosyltransferase|nr:anthranilate phosphoribosyltransferase [Succinimonas sp.]